MILTEVNKAASELFWNSYPWSTWNLGISVGGKELRCNLMFWLRGGKRLLIKVFTPFFPQPDLIKTPPFLPLYSLNFSKTRKLFQSIFLLFYLNQGFVYQICQSHLGVSASTEGTQKRATSPSSCSGSHSSTGLSPKPRPAPVWHWFICCRISLQLEWKVECGYPPLQLHSNTTVSP